MLVVHLHEAAIDVRVEALQLLLRLIRHEWPVREPLRKALRLYWGEPALVIVIISRTYIIKLRVSVEVVVIRTPWHGYRHFLLL